jgi:hypothetical protein
VRVCLLLTCGRPRRSRVLVAEGIPRISQIFRLCIEVLCPKPVRYALVPTERFFLAIIGCQREYVRHVIVSWHFFLCLEQLDFPGLGSRSQFKPHNCFCLEHRTLAYMWPDLPDLTRHTTSRILTQLCYLSPPRDLRHHLRAVTWWASYTSAVAAQRHNNNRLKITNNTSSTTNTRAHRRLRSRCRGERYRRARRSGTATR